MKLLIYIKYNTVKNDTHLSVSFERLPSAYHIVGNKEKMVKKYGIPIYRDRYGT